MQNDDAMLQYAHKTTPRYTSYPTAADFYNLDDAPRLAALRQITAHNRISAYIHIPYCRAMCLYCGCFTKVTNRADVLADYVQCLIRDIKQQSAYFVGRPKLTHLHWGGGTPSIISQADFSAIMEALHSAFDFDARAEHAIELDPRTVDPALCAFLARCGVNRASLGVQDIAADVQQAIGRIQPFDTVAKTVDDLRASGIEQINFDLIYGLPLQTTESLLTSCKQLLTLKPSRIACYGYAHLPQRRANQRLIAEETLPDAAERLAQAAAVADFWQRCGYESIGIDHFALPQDSLAKAAQSGALHRNFQGYTNDNAAVLLGFGASAISEFPNLYAQTCAAIEPYKKAVREGGLGTARGIALNTEDKRRAAVIRDLMCSFRVDLGDYGGADRFQSELIRLKPLLRDNMAQQCGDIISMTDAGKPFVRLVAALFDSYRQKPAAQFSPSV